jgi:hypothetical protein
MNFFAGPAKADFKASINFYDVHYMGHHVVGSSGGNTKDLQDAMNYAAQGLITPSVMITHVGGIESVAETTKTFRRSQAARKLVYTHVSMPMTRDRRLSDARREGPLLCGGWPRFAGATRGCGAPKPNGTC